MGTSYCVIVKRSGVESMQNECNQLFVLKDENILRCILCFSLTGHFGLLTDLSISFLLTFFLFSVVSLCKKVSSEHD